MNFISLRSKEAKSEGFGFFNLWTDFRTRPEIIFRDMINFLYALAIDDSTAQT